MQYTISFFHDTRREKASGKYPVKLRVYSTLHRKDRLYSLSTLKEGTDGVLTDLSIKEYQSILETTKTRSEFLVQKNVFEEIKVRAEKVAKKITRFNFEEFERKLFRTASDSDNVFYHYDSIISKLTSNNQHGTKGVYELSVKAIKKYLTFKNLNSAHLTFYSVTQKFLTSLENYMVNDLDLSYSTIGMYLRTLRTVFNTAINDKEIDHEIYPFGSKNKGKYEIPVGKAKKMALPKTQLAKVYKAKPFNQQQEKAKDFFFFSYACNGMNVKDILLLKWQDIKTDTFTFYRAKTLSTQKAKKPITVSLHESAKACIEKYGNPSSKPNGLVFDIITAPIGSLDAHNQIKAFTRFINQHMTNLLKANNIEFSFNISTYTARHSFATIAINEKMGMEYVSDAFGHNSLKTTQGYFEGFDSKIIKANSNKLMKF